MKKNVNVIQINLYETNNNNISSRKKESITLANGGISSSKEKNQKKQNFIFNKKKLNKIIIPNSCHKTNIKKINNKSDKQKLKSSSNSNLNLQNKKNKTNLKRQSSSLIRRNKNSPFKLSTGKTTLDNKKLNLSKNKNKTKLRNSLNNINNNNKINNINNYNYNSHRIAENKNNSKSKKISIFNDKTNYYINGNKVLSNGKSKEKMPIYHKKIDKNNKLFLIHKNKLNISSDNAKKRINYYNRKENILITNNNLIMKNIKDNIYNKEINLKNIYYPKSPTNKSIIFKKQISPIKKVNFIKNKQNENKSIIDNNNNINNNKNIKAPSSYRIFQTEGNFPNNHGYHEIIYKNSPQKTLPNNNINNIKEEKYKKLNEFIQNTTLRNNRPFLEELTTDNNNNNFNNISTTILINNQSLNNLDTKMVVPYYYTLNSNKNISLQSTIKDENYLTNENICVCSSQRNLNNSALSPKLFLSPTIKKLDVSNDIETENEEQQTIHYFGEQMLERNKNYNFNKINDIYMFPIDGIKNTELKRNNSTSDINKENSNQKKGIKSIPFSYSYNQFRWKKYQKRNSNNNISKDKSNNNNNQNKNKRFNHNIVNRKKNKKLVMEKSLNEQFISCSNKSKNNDFTKDKISCCESSINIDNDSINDIIKEFEKEMEAEEKKNKQNKTITKRIGINNIDYNNDNLLYSFLSENDNYSNLSKGSTDDSKIKKKKIRYYKTKNFELEKNYDFFISPTKVQQKK